MRLLISPLQSIANALFNGQLVLVCLVFLGSNQSHGQRKCGSACTKGYKAYFGVQILLKILKDNFEKNKTAVFRKRISAKTAVFSVFKTVKQVK